MQRIGKPATTGDDLVRDETGSAAIETALLLCLVAAMVLVMRSALVGPLLQKFVDAANTLSRALG